MKSVENPENWVEAGAGGVKEIVKQRSGFNLIGSFDGKSCNLIYNIVLDVRVC